MKKCPIFILFFGVTISMQAQLPDWTRNTPRSNNYESAYEVGIGEGSTASEAERNAFYNMLEKFLARCGLQVQTVMASARKGVELSILTKDYNLPIIYEACSPQTIKLKGNIYRTYVLYHVPRDGSIINPQLYYESFNDCDKISQYSNGKALVASFFIPGLGQMIKRRYTEGSFTLIGELALVGGGVGTYFIGKEQLKIMQDRNVEYGAFQSAKNMYNTMRIVSYTCYGAAAALYIFNLYRAYTVTPRIKNGIAFYPTLIPTNEYVQPTYTMGAGMSINF